MPTPAKVFIVCKVRGASADGSHAVISSDPAAAGSHLGFAFPAAAARLAGCPPRTNVPIETGSLAECKAKGEAYLRDELPAAWSIDASDALLAHVWREGVGWVPIGGTGEFTPHSFRLRRGAEPYQDFATVADPADPTRAQRLVLEYYVVVQPMSVQ
jgi:hypothetical protein